MSNVGVYFSDFFDIDEDIIESYGAVNISLINDLPLFIDPFLLFNSERIEFQRIHQEMIRYLLFLQVQAEKSAVLTAGMRARRGFHFQKLNKHGWASAYLVIPDVEWETTLPLGYMRGLVQYSKDSDVGL